MSELVKDGDGHKLLTRESYTAAGELVSKEDELSLVVESASKAETWESNKQWNLLWRDSDILYQSPRPMTMWEGSYILEPNVTRFTVAKTVQTLVPQFYKGLFYEDPPMVTRPRPGTSQAVVDAKKAIASYLFDECQFKREVKYGLEQFCHLGTCIFKWGVAKKKINIPTRKSVKTNVQAGMQGSESITPDTEPNITDEERVVTRLTFEYRDIRDVLVDPHCELPDVRQAGWVIDKRYMDFYQLQELAEDAEYDIPDEIIDLWFPPSEVGQTPAESAVMQQTNARSVVHHAEDPLLDVSGDPLRRKLEVLEFWDAQRTIVVLNRKKVIKSKENKFKVVPFLSANFWNRPKSFWGMGVGLIAGQNQRVDQGAINAILKILSFNANPVYQVGRDVNTAGQTIRTGLGKIVRVDDIQQGGYKLLDMPKIDPNAWNALRESQAATETATGADQMLVGGSSAGPRTSMGRTSGGANILAGASAGRLEGPLDNFIEQVFRPFLYVLDDLVFRYMPDHEIQDLLGQELGKTFQLDLDHYHSGRVEYDVLAGASIAAKRTMQQSLVLLTQLFENPQIQQSLAEINGEYIDYKPILNMWMEASEWRNPQDIIKPLTPEMKQRMAAKAQANQKLATQQAMEQQKFQNKQELLDQENENRMKRDIVRQAFKDAAMGPAIDGEPGDKGFGSE